MGELLEKFSGIPAAQKFLILLLVMGLVGGAWYSLSIMDLDEQLESARRDTQKLNNDLTAENAKVANLRKFEEEVETLKKQREEMTDKLPADEEIASLLQKIHSQGKIVGLEINRFERDAPKVAELFVRIPVKMTLSGTFHQIATFFYYVGKLTRIVNVEDINLTIDRQDPKAAASLQATCTATTFMYRPAGLPVPGGAKP
jgi:type IV pilus assembly protein PilO